MNFKEGSHYGQFNSFGEDLEQLLHLLFPLPRNRPINDVRKKNYRIAYPILILVKTYITKLVRTKIFGFNLTSLQKDHVLLLTETDNQKMAIMPISDAFKKKRLEVFWCKQKSVFRIKCLSECVKAFYLTFKNIVRYNFYLNHPQIAKSTYFFLIEAMYYRRVLAEKRPKSILVANDHNPSIMAMQYSAHLLGIPVDYVQHAHVTRAFPKPEYLRNIFTDGDVASEIYQDLIPSNRFVQIHPIGPVRFESAYSELIVTRAEKVAMKIGIAFDYDCTILCDQGIENMLMCGEDEINIRFHPRTKSIKKDEIISDLRKRGIRIHYFNQTSPIEFILNSRIIFSGQSSILFEAALFNRIPVCISKEEDYYGFVQSGLAYNEIVFPEDLQKFELDKQANIRKIALSEYVSASFLSGCSPMASARIVDIVVDCNNS